MSDYPRSDSPRPGQPGRFGSAVRIGAALCITVLLTSGCVALDDVMASIFGRSMRDQRSMDPYENLDQNALLPPEGAVAFSSGNMAATHFGVNVGRTDGAADVPTPFTQTEMTQNPDVVDNLVNPVPASAESLARGQEMFNRSCAPCHGEDGVGTSGYIYEVFPVMAAYPLTSGNAMTRSDGYIYGMIRVGRGLMPSYGHQIGHYDRWHIVNYVRQLQGVLPSGEGN